MSAVLPGLAEALAAQQPGLYVDQPEVLEEDLDEPTPVLDVCDTCGGSGLDCQDDGCYRCPNCGGCGWLP